MKQHEELEAMYRQICAELGQLEFHYTQAWQRLIAQLDEVVAEHKRLNPELPPTPMEE